MSDRDDKLAFLGGELAIEASEIYGSVGPFGEDGPLIVVADDKNDVIRNFERELENNSFENIRFVLFRISRQAGSTRTDFVEWLKSLGEVAAVFIDGDLTDQGNGLDLISIIQKKPELKYLPAAILTADSSFINKNKRRDDRIRLMPKFEQKSINTLRRLAVEYMDVRAEARSAFWSDLQFSVAAGIQRAEPLEEVIQLVGNELETNLGVCGWYFRILRENAFSAIAMNDHFNAGKDMALSDVPRFQRDLLDGIIDAKSWNSFQILSRSECDTKQHMIGYNCISALVGGASSIRNAIFSAYTKPNSFPLSDADARELHHIGMQLRTLLDVEEGKEKLGSLATVIGRILSSTSSEDVATELRDFVHSLINSPRDSKVKSKTNVRLIERGSGGLVRRGRDTSEYANQTLRTTNSIGVIDLNDLRSAYARAVKYQEPELQNNQRDDPRDILHSAKDLCSFLTVPIAIDEACLGAINLETTQCDAFSNSDLLLVNAICEVSATAIFSLRAQRFVQQITEFAERVVDPLSIHDGSPEGLLEDAALALHDFVGFSNMILLEPTKKSRMGSPWQVVAGWHSTHDGLEQDNSSQIEKWKKTFAKNWEETFVVKALNASPQQKIHFTNQAEEILKDHGRDGIRPNRPTLSQVVVKIGLAKGQDRALSILFEHPSPIPISYFSVLERFSTFLAAVYSANEADIKEYGYRLNRSRSEARILRQFGDMRHAVIGELTKIASELEYDISDGIPHSDIIDRLQKDLQKFGRLVLGTRYLESDPVITTISVGSIWNSVADSFANREDLSLPVVRRTRCQLEVSFDENFLKSIFFHLVDNAVQHSKNATEIKLERDRKGVRVVDDGRPIHQSTIREMFKLGFTTSATGSGQGLYIARARALELGGDLKYRRIGDKNHFIVELKE